VRADEKLTAFLELESAIENKSLGRVVPHEALEVLFFLFLLQRISLLEIIPRNSANPVELVIFVTDLLFT
jgi:hypothetical protein